MQPVNVFYYCHAKRFFLIKMLILSILITSNILALTALSNTSTPYLPLSSANISFPLFPQNNSNLDAGRLLLIVDSLDYKQSIKADSLLLLVFQMALSDQITDSVLLADVYHRQGKYMDRHQMYAEALEAFDKSISIKTTRQTTDSAILAQSYNYKGIVYMRLKYPDSALICFNQASKLLNNQIKNYRDLYDVSINTGIIYSMIGNYDQAYSHFQKAYSILQSYETVPDSLMVAAFHTNYGLFATSIGKTDEALEHYAISENIYRIIMGERHAIIGTINMNKGMNAYYNYDFEKAKLYMSEALEIYLENKDFVIGVPKSLYNLGSLSLSTGKNTEAINYSQLGLSYSPENDLRLMLTLNLARAYKLNNNLKESDEQFRNALHILTQDNISQTRATKVYEKYAEFLLFTNQVDSGYKYLCKALAESQQLYGFESNQNAHLITSMGDYFLTYDKKPDSALRRYLMAIELWGDLDSIQLDNFSKTQYAKARAGEAQSLAALALLTGRQDYLLQSEAVFDQALKQMLSLSLTLSSENKLVLSEMLKPLYQQAIGIEYQLYMNTNNPVYMARAFQFAESSKSAVLAASVNNQYALKTADLPIPVFEFENKIKSGISTLQRILATEVEKKSPDERKVPYYNNKLIALMNQYDSLIQHIETSYPKYYQLKYNSGVVEAKKITEQLQNNEVLIEYELTDSVLYRIILDKTGIRFNSSPADSAFFSALTRLISVKNTHIEIENQQSFHQFKQDAHLLYKTLLGNINLETNTHKITIVPDGLLGYLPFEMLIEFNPPDGEINYRDLPYVFLHHPMSYAPSATLKYSPFFLEENHPSNNKFLTFAPSYHANNLKDNTNRAEVLKPLPFANREAREISGLMGGKAFIGQTATKENFKSDAENYGLLHLAMHALINDTLPMMSKLVFYDELNDTLSPFLNIFEIYGLSLNAKQVVLSACNTGSGKFKKGEGIMSLARGFLFAGVPSIVMTLWEVQDEQGALLMNHYYRLLKQGLPKDVALQQAKIVVLKGANMAKAHPFFWSSYILSGDTSPIVNKWVKWWWIGGLMFSALFFFILIRKRHLRQTNS